VGEFFVGQARRVLVPDFAQDLNAPAAVQRKAGSEFHQSPQPA
jgi:hypothetical protein